MLVQVATKCELLHTVRTRHFLFLVGSFDVLVQVAPRCTLLLTVGTRLFLFLVDTTDVPVQFKSINLLLTMRALGPLVVVHLSNVPNQAALC